MAFIEENNNGLIYMRSDLIPLRHAFTTRYGGVSKGYLSSLNLISNHGDEPANIAENFRRVSALMGVGPNDCAVTNQVHGNTVRIVDGRDRHEVLSKTPYEADGLVTATPGLPITCCTADCVPILLCDTYAGVVGAIHCGWRGSVADILGNAIKAMQSLNADPERILAAIGPAIGKCCFETDDDVPDAIEEWLSGDTAGLFQKKPDGKTLVDLRSANARRLRQLGLGQNQIDISEECTYCSHEKYWSHRYTKGKRGGQCAIIVLPTPEECK